MLCTEDVEAIEEIVDRGAIGIGDVLGDANRAGGSLDNKGGSDCDLVRLGLVMIGELIGLSSKVEWRWVGERTSVDMVSMKYDAWMKSH